MHDRQERERAGVAKAHAERVAQAFHGRLQELPLAAQGGLTIRHYG